jgi:hypothetical protein
MTRAISFLRMAISFSVQGCSQTTKQGFGQQKQPVFGQQTWIPLQCAASAEGAEVAKAPTTDAKARASRMSFFLMVLVSWKVIFLSGRGLCLRALDRTRPQAAVTPAIRTADQDAIAVDGLGRPGQEESQGSGRSGQGEREGDQLFTHGETSSREQAEMCLKHSL